jgi:hypothetical protein
LPYGTPENGTAAHQDQDDPNQYSNSTCGVQALPDQGSPTGSHAHHAPAAKRRRVDSAVAAENAASAGGGQQRRPEAPDQDAERMSSGARTSTSGVSARPAEGAPSFRQPRTNPIDHIFQFHKVRSLPRHAHALAGVLPKIHAMASGLRPKQSAHVTADSSLPSVQNVVTSQHNEVLWN